MDDLSKKERDFTGVLNETEKWDLCLMWRGKCGQLGGII